MTVFSWRTACIVLVALASPITALAVAQACPPAASSGGGDADAARMSCDLERAGLIRTRASDLYGATPPAMLEVIDTAAPSGAAYLYDIVNDGTKLRLDARSVPKARGPRCRLQATLPDDTASAVTSLLAEAGDPELPEYGVREDVTINADGSRSTRLVFDSHDIITRAETSQGPRSFSRHAGSDDPVSRLNNLVIGFANVSPGWTCQPNT